MGDDPDGDKSPEGPDGPQVPQPPPPNPFGPGDFPGPNEGFGYADTDSDVDSLNEGGLHGCSTPPDFYEQRESRSSGEFKSHKLINKPLGTPAAADEEDSLRCSLRVDAPHPPKLQVVERGLTNLVVKASGVTVGSTVEVQHFVEGEWIAAAPQVKATSETVLFTIRDLAENWTYRLRLRTVLELEPLTLLFAEFAQEPEPDLVVPVQQCSFEGDFDDNNFENAGAWDEELSADDQELQDSGDEDLGT